MRRDGRDHGVQRAAHGDGPGAARSARPTTSCRSWANAVRRHEQASSTRPACSSPAGPRPPAPPSPTACGPSATTPTSGSRLRDDPDARARRPSTRSSAGSRRSTTSSARRVADRPIGDQAVAEGDRVMLLYPSANRDEAVFDDPFTFDITRQPNPHVAFGYGTHFCIGANFAKYELQLLFAELTQRFRPPCRHRATWSPTSSPGPSAPSGRPHPLLTRPVPMGRDSGSRSGDGGRVGRGRVGRCGRRRPGSTTSGPLVAGGVGPAGRRAERRGPAERPRARGVHERIGSSLRARLQVVDWRAAHPEVADEVVGGPVIIVGLPRTGTTALSNLLAQDPDTRSLRVWESAARCRRRRGRNYDPRIAASSRAGPVPRDGPRGQGPPRRHGHQHGRGHRPPADELRGVPRRRDGPGVLHRVAARPAADGPTASTATSSRSCRAAARRPGGT